MREALGSPVILQVGPVTLQVGYATRWAKRRNVRALRVSTRSEGCRRDWSPINTPLRQKARSKQLAYTSFGSLRTRKQRGTCQLLRLQILPIYPFFYKMTILVPHHHFRAAPGATIPLCKRDCAANGLRFTRVGLRKSPPSLDDLPSGLLADDYVS